MPWSRAAARVGTGGLRAAALAAGLVIAGVAAAATPPGRIGAYRLEKEADALVIRATSPWRAGWAAVAAGLAVAGLARAGALGGARRGPRTALLLAGLGLATVGGVALLQGGTVWRASADGLVEARRVGPATRTPREAIARIEIGRRRAAGTDQDAKSVAEPRLWVVRAGPARFTLASAAEARALAAELGRALQVEVGGASPR